MLTQICAYADDIGLIARSKPKLVEVFKVIEEKSKEVILFINDGKTQYMITSADRYSNPVDLEFDSRSFKYLGNLPHNNANCSIAIAYTSWIHGLLCQSKSIGGETWTLTGTTKKY